MKSVFNSGLKQTAHKEGDFIPDQYTIDSSDDK